MQLGRYNVDRVHERASVLFCIFLHTFHTTHQRPRSFVWISNSAVQPGNEFYREKEREKNYYEKWQHNFHPKMIQCMVGTYALLVYEIPEYFSYFCHFRPIFLYFIFQVLSSVLSAVLWFCIAPTKTCVFRGLVCSNFFFFLTVVGPIHAILPPGIDSLQTEMGQCLQNTLF